MKIKQSFGGKMFDALNVIFLLMLIAVTIVPVWHVIMASFSDSAAMMGQKGLLLKPIGFNTRGYEIVLSNSNVWTGFGVSIFIVIVGTTLSIIFTVLAAYFLTKSKSAMLSSLFAYIIVFSMYFSVGLIPKYLVVKSLGLYDSIFALIIPVLINSYNTIIMRTAISSVPEALFESAELDGASQITIISKIVIPLCMPTIAVLILYYGVAHWNSWFDASIYIRDAGKKPLQLLLKEIMTTSEMMEIGDNENQLSTQEVMKYALIVVSSLPIMCVYPFLQKYFVKGVMIGAVKG